MPRKGFCQYLCLMFVARVCVLTKKIAVEGFFFSNKTPELLLHVCVIIIKNVMFK